MPANLSRTGPPRDPARIRRVESLLAAQMRPTQIARTIAAEFGVNERTVRTDIDRVYAMSEGADAMTRAKRRNTMRMSLSNLFQRCVAAKDYRGAGFALDRLCRLDGLFAAEQIEVSATVARRPEAMTSQRQRGRMVELQEIAAERMRRAGGVTIIPAPKPTEDDGDMTDVLDALSDDGDIGDLGGD